MGLFKYSGGNHIRKKTTSAEVFAAAGGASSVSEAQIFENAANILQLAKDMYDSPSLDGDAQANLTTPLEFLGAPVGTIKPFYDFGGLVSFDTDKWAYCDGSVVADAASPLNGQTLPDMSNRYMVGFGTEGGGDIDTDTWATAAVGNASHQANLSHIHTMPTHSHGAGSLQFLVATADYTAIKGLYSVELNLYTSGGVKTPLFTISSTGNDGSGEVGATAVETVGQSDYYTASGSGSTQAVDPGDTNSALSSSQNVQPRSIRVRYIMRVK